MRGWTIIRPLFCVANISLDLINNLFGVTNMLQDLTNKAFPEGKKFFTGK